MYQGTPKEVPSTSVVPQAPSKKALESIRSVGVGSSAPLAANSETHVLPTRLTSGVLLPAMAVAILLWAASNGMTVMLTLDFGLSASKSAAISPSLSPSAPRAHTVMSPLALPAPTLSDLTSSVPALLVPAAAGQGDRGHQR